jgi:hypothetical protein
MVGFNPVALTCVAVSLGVAVMLTVRTRKIAWGPALISLVLFSGYELLHLWWGPEFIYVDDNKTIPIRFNVAHDLYLVGLGVGVLGLTLMAVRYVIVRMIE